MGETRVFFLVLIPLIFVVLSTSAQDWGNDLSTSTPSDGSSSTPSVESWDTSPTSTAPQMSFPLSSSSTTDMPSSSTTAQSIGDYIVASTSTQSPSSSSTNSPTTSTVTPHPIAIVKSSNSSKTTVIRNPNGKGGISSFKSSSSYVKIRPGGAVSGKNKGSNIQKSTSFSESKWSGSQTAVDGGEVLANFANMQIIPQNPYGFTHGMGIGAPPAQAQAQGVGKSPNGKAKGLKTNPMTAGDPGQFPPQPRQGKATDGKKTNGQKNVQGQMGMNPPMGMYMPQNQMYPGMGQPMMQQAMFLPNMYGAPMMYNG